MSARKRPSLEVLTTAFEGQRREQPKDDEDALVRTYMELLYVAREGASKQPEGSSARETFNSMAQQWVRYIRVFGGTALMAATGQVIERAGKRARTAPTTPPSRKLVKTRHPGIYRRGNR